MRSLFHIRSEIGTTRCFAHKARLHSPSTFIPVQWLDNRLGNRRHVSSFEVEIACSFMHFRILCCNVYKSIWSCFAIIIIIIMKYNFSIWFYILSPKSLFVVKCFTDCSKVSTLCFLSFEDQIVLRRTNTNRIIEGRQLRLFKMEKIFWKLLTEAGSPSPFLICSCSDLR